MRLQRPSYNECTVMLRSCAATGHAGHRLLKSRSTNWLRGFVALTGLSLAVVVGPVSAHDSLRSSSPADDGRPGSAPAEWVLSFAGEVPLESTSPDGLGSGETARSGGSGAPDVVRWILRLIGFAAVMLIGGFLIADLHLIRGAFSALRRSPVLKGTAVAVAAVPMIQMLIFLGDVEGTSLLGGLGHLVSIFDSTPGSMLFVRSAAGVLLAYQLVNVLPFNESVKVQRLALATFGIYLIALAYTGHSRSMAAPYLGVPADVVHTAAASVWLGGLAVLVLFISPFVSSRDLFRSFQRYGRVAKPAVIALIVTGSIQTLRLHGGIGSLFTEGHGRLLLLKIALVAITLRLGDVNRKRVSSKMMENPHIFDTRMAVLLRMGTMEVVSGTAILAVTAALVGSSLD